MTAPTRRLLWALILVTLLLAVTGTAVVSVFGLPTVVTSLLKRPVTEPKSEDYAIYSAFVDGFFFSDRPFRVDPGISQDSVVYIVSETLPRKNPGSVIPLEVAALGPDDMGEDFFRQNARPWHLQPRFHTRVRVILADSDTADRARSLGMDELFERLKKSEEPKWLTHASRAGPIPEHPSFSRVLQLSRVGLNRRGTLALLYYRYRCGASCGQFGWVVLSKTEGNWHIQQFGPGAIY